MPSPALPHEQDYSVFGLRVRSSIPLPELFVADGNGEPDVIIDHGRIEAADNGSGLLATKSGLLLTVPEAARFLITAGNSIRVEPREGVDPRNVRLFLLGSAFGALLHQRGLLPLHANAIEIDSMAVAFMGDSGAGKSTLAMWCHWHGYSIVSDDVCVVRFSADGIALAQPGLPRLRLREDALQTTRRSTEGLHRSYLDEAADYDKFDVPIGSSTAARGPVPLSAVYLLERGEEPLITQLFGIDAADAVFANTYRGAFLNPVSSHPEHWQSAMDLVRSTPVFRAVRVWDLARIDEQSRLLINHAEIVIGGDTHKPQRA